MHPGQLAVTPATVRTLLSEQFPGWRDMRIAAVRGAGTVNAIFRLGDQLVARFPLQAGDVAVARRQLEHEASVAEELFGHTPFATPRPVAIGEPGAGYPMPWSIYTWLPGNPATGHNVSSSPEFATDLATFITAVRAMDARGRTFAGTGRGGDLSGHDDWMQESLCNSRGLLDVKTYRQLWAEMRTLPRGDSPDVMTHGDLIAPNVLVGAGRLVGVLDVGGLGAADPALDLVAAWHLLGSGPRRRLRDHLGCDDAEWLRGRAWAFQQAMGAVWYYAESNPSFSESCRLTLQRVAADRG